MPEIPISTNFDFGFGLDSATGVAKANAIDFDQPTTIDPGQKTITKIEIVKQSSELSRLLEVEARFSLDSLGQNGSAEASMSRFIEVNEYFTYGLLRSVVTNPRRLVQNPRLKPEALRLLQQEGYKAFVRQYGDQFIEGVVSGGSYYAMIIVETKSLEEKEQARAALSYSFGAGGISGSAKAELKEKLTKLRENNVITIFTRQSGGVGDPTELTLDEMLDQVQNFSIIANDAPVTMRAIVSNYQDRVVMPQPEPEDSLPKINQRDVLNDFGANYIKLRDYKANLEFILQNISDFDQFRELSGEDLDNKRTMFRDDLNIVLDDIDLIASASRACASDLGQCSNFSPRAKFLELPTIGGQNLSIKQMQEQLITLRQQYESVVSQLSALQSSAIENANRITSVMTTANDALGQATVAQNTANDALGRANGAQNTADAARAVADSANIIGKKIVLKERGSTVVGTFTESSGGGRGGSTQTTYLATNRSSFPSVSKTDFTIELA